MKRSARSAVSARKHSTQTGQATELVNDLSENEAKESEGDYDHSLDGMTEEEIEYTNAFEVLTSHTDSVPHPPKKRKQKPNLTQFNSKLSTFDRSRVEYIDNNVLQITLLPDEIVTVCGSYLLSVVQGSISILGAKLKPSTPVVSHSIHAPLSHSLPVIKGLRSKNTKSSESVVQLRSHRSGIERISEICPFAESLFQPPANSITVYPKEPTFHILFDSPTAIAQTLYPVSWLEAFQTISSDNSPRVLVCGQKGSGKSTFSQYLVNSFIRHNPITYLDTDPGQPSFSPPGMISMRSISQPILSAPFTCTEMNDIVRCHHIGNISPRDNPRYYIDCITDLLSYVTQAAPSVINTPGWTKGTGLELLTSLIEIAMPKFIIVLSSFGNDSLAQNLRPIASLCQSHLLLVGSANTIPPAIQLTAADLRALGIMSYFHHVSSGKWDFTTHLTAWRPWVVKYSGSSEQGGIWAIAIQGEELLPEDIVLAISGTMVAIVLESDTTGVVSSTPEGIPMLSNREAKFMEPRSSRCVGYAVIRGIDVKNGWLLLLSPCDPSILQGERMVLERGHVNLPVWGMWNHKMPRILGPWLKKL